MGFPVLLKATSGDLGAAGGVVILAVTLTRAPLLVPLTAMQGNLIAHFVDQRAAAAAAAGRAGGDRGGVGGGRRRWPPGSLGPWLLRVAFGPEYQAGGALLAWLTTAAIAIALLTLTGAATVAAALHRAYAAGWIGATVASTLLLLLPVGLETRTVVALLCGPMVGIAVHLVALAQGIRHSERVFWAPSTCDTATRTCGSSSPPINEASVIGDVIADVRTVFDHVVCVDDGSRDDTGELRAAGRRPRGSPPGESRTGRGDSDRRRVRPQQAGRRRCSRRSTPTASTASRTSSRMIDRLSTEDLDIVVGTRFAEPSAEQMPPLRRLLILLHRGKLSPTQPQAGADRCAQRAAGVQQDRRRRAEHHHERDEPRERVHRARSSKTIGGWPKSRSRSSTPTTRCPRASRCSTASTSSSTGCCEGGCSR